MKRKFCLICESSAVVWRRSRGLFLGARQDAKPQSSCVVI